MLYDELLIEIDKEIGPIVSKAFDIAYAKQAHQGDMLMLLSHGQLRSTDKDESASPAVGPFHIGHAMQSQMKFIGDFRKNKFPTKTQYYEELAKNSKLAPPEDLSVHIELLMYQKLWEMSMFQKQIYQLSRLLNGLTYSWRGLPTLKTKDNLEIAFKNIYKAYPPLQKCFKSAYRSTIRNAIAHSEFYTVLESKIYDDKGVQLLRNGENGQFLLLKDWDVIISKSLLLQSHFQIQMDRYNMIYQQKSKDTNGKIMVKAMFQISAESEYAYDPANNQWIPFENLAASEK